MQPSCRFFAKKALGDTIYAVLKSNLPSLKLQQINLLYPLPVIKSWSIRIFPDELIIFISLFYNESIHYSISFQNIIIVIALRNIMNIIAITHIITSAIPI